MLLEKDAEVSHHKKGVAVFVDLQDTGMTQVTGDSGSSLQNSFLRFRDQKIRERKMLITMQKERYINTKYSVECFATFFTLAKEWRGPTITRF